MATRALVGRKIVVVIQGDGNVIDATDAMGKPVPSINGGILQKRVFNTRTNSQTAVQNQRNRDLLAQIKIADKAGDAAKVDELVNEYLNKVQLTFNVLSGSPFFEEGSDLQNGAEVSATLQEITTEKGSFMTLDPSSISVMKPATLEDSKFSMDLSDDDATPAGPDVPTVDLNEALTIEGKTFTRAQWNSAGWTDAAIAAKLGAPAAAAMPTPPTP